MHQKGKKCVSYGYIFLWHFLTQNKIPSQKYQKGRSQEGKALREEEKQREREEEKRKKWEGKGGQKVGEEGIHTS